MLIRPITCPVLLGRDAVIQALRDSFGLVQNGHGQIALISGEAGIGKSRLVYELRQQMQASASACFQGNSTDIDQSLPYAPIVDMLRTAFRGMPILRQQTVAKSYAADIARLLPELAEDLSSSTPGILNDEQAKRQLHQALIQFMAEQTAGQPLLVIIEDLHWCDEASLDFLLVWARHLHTQRILLVLTFREEETNTALNRFLAHLDRERLTTAYKLPRLEADTVAKMAAAIFGETFSSRRKFLEAIYTLTDGNPFFVEEMLKSLVAAGDIYLAGQEWKLKPLFELHIPRTVEIGVQQRIRQLSGSCRRILSLAAVAGRHFDFQLLQHLTYLSEIELVQIIRELRDAQFVSEESADRFAFRHALTRQVIYKDLLLREQRILHQTIGDALEHLYKDNAAYAGEIASHYFQAEQWVKGAGYSLQAASNAQHLYAPGVAIEHYNRAITSLERLNQEP